MKRNRCWIIPVKEHPDAGYTFIRIRAVKRPDQKTVKALQDLYDAASRAQCGAQNPPRPTR